MTESIVPYSLDSLFAATGVGSLDKAITNSFYGINHMAIPGISQTNRDHQGYVFMTRPQLNLQTPNIRNVRELYPLLNGDPRSTAKAIRCLLDPRIMAGYSVRTRNSISHVPAESCILVDNNQAFIPLITNNTVSLSGFPDGAMNTWSADVGIHKEVYNLPDGIYRNYGEYDLTLNVLNMASDPISLMMHTWLMYLECVRLGEMSPYPDYLFNNRRDYDTRIYRIVLDHRMERVTKIMACGVGYPTSNPIGMFGDFNRETPFSTQTKEIPVRIHCTGMIAYDPKLIDDFNTVVEIFNPAMEDGYRDNYMTMLSKMERRIYNFRCYPRIDPDTMEMQWWTPNDTYEALKDSKKFIEPIQLQGELSA